MLVNSGASANLILLQSLINLGYLQKGDLIAFSALTWSTNVMPIIQLGLTPIPVDCSRFTLNSGVGELQSLLEQVKPSAFFITNALGLAGKLDKVAEICSANNIIFLEDSCESIGSEINGVKTGNFGVASTFSFFVAHHMSTIEGGMVCTDDTELYEMLLQVRANGWDRNLPEKSKANLRMKYSVQSEFYAKYTFYNLAYNVRPTEITGFLGRQQLLYLDKTIEARQDNFLRIQEVLNSNGDFCPLRFGHMSKVSAFALPFVLKSPSLMEFYISRFQDAGIEIRPMIAGNMQNQPFYGKYSDRAISLPESDHLHASSFYSGNFPDLSDSELSLIESCIKR